jgi:4-amino-4-deoxy-L-arabinose transferase-like glycosyltransferase
VSARGRYSTFAWGAIGLAVAFIGLTCWWLSQDRSIPIYDAGDHLWGALYFHELLARGDLLGPFNYTWQYPPLGHVIGALALFVGGVNVASPIIGENLVFVSLLTLGCYQTGKLLFGPLAGMLAAAFALGSPLLIAQFHVFMLDAPETALVAVSIWLILASRQFSRVAISALAGVAVAAGLEMKVQFPFFVLGIVLWALLRGGWRNWRGLLAFAGVAFALGSPWYLAHLSELKEISRLAGSNSGAIASQLPPTFSIENLTWYLWTILNNQLLLPLFVLLAVGFVWTLARLVRPKGDRFGERMEFIVGGVVAWIAVSVTPHHDLRYAMPLLPYMAVMATGWIASAPLFARRIAVAVLVGGVALNTIGTTFGSGGEVALGVGSGISSTYLLPPSVVAYSSRGYLVAGPSRDGDVPGLLTALRRDGVRTVASAIGESEAPDFSFEGLTALALIADVEYNVRERLTLGTKTSSAFLVHRASLANGAPPCVTLSDRTGVFVVRPRPPSGEPSLYCPYPRPHYY